jgi:hypothetical protein
MKKFTLLFLFVLAGDFMFSQINWPTYYINPPSSGCDGLWAVNASQTGGVCGQAPYTYSLTPSSCGSVSGISYSGDTMFIPLCSLPCDFMITNFNGQECVGSTGTTAQKEISKEPAKIFPSTIKPGEIVTLEFGDANAERTIQLFDNNGKCIQQSVTKNKTMNLAIPDAASGMYFISVSGPAGIQLLKVLIGR